MQQDNHAIVYVVKIFGFGIRPWWVGRRRTGDGRAPERTTLGPVRE